MARLARIRLAGTLAAIATCAAATEAAAQEGPLVLNNQLQLGDVISGQTLNVEGVGDQVTVTNAATGNSLTGYGEYGPIDLRSAQDMRGDARATTRMTLGGETGVLNAHTQATGNHMAGSAREAQAALQLDQTTGPREIQANSTLGGPNGADVRLLHGGYVTSAARANTVALGGRNVAFDGQINQTNQASVRASNFAAMQYIPAEAEFSSQAVANGVAVSTEGSSSQAIGVRQYSQGDIVSADVSANAANAWDITGRAHATGNQFATANQGGSMIVGTDQQNAARIQAQSVVTSYDYGRAVSYAQGAGNSAEIGNADIWLEIDNTQLNTGGVESRASFAGNTGYDAYVSAEAAGNTVTGYACSECGSTMTVNNRQTNSGNVTATANTGVYGSGRAVITGANAVGNAATFYTSGGSGH